MYGPPGCSKTLVARALAAESRFNFLSIKGPELLSKYVGDTELNIREVFRKAKLAAPAIIFFDEFDAIAKRDTGHESLSPVTALLTEMDGFEALEGVLVLAATNRPWVIDEALLRPGRFDLKHYVGLPDHKAREQILRIKLRNLRMADDIDLPDLARRSEGWSGAEMTDLCEKAIKDAIAPVFKGEIEEVHVEISQRHLDKAFSQIIPGTSETMLRQFEEWKLAHSAH
jgi:SpoVK/Ycf46/Vps4 family AAA+-type ATPase